MVMYKGIHFHVICECLYLIFIRINIENLMVHKINFLMLDRPANIIMEIF